MPQALPNGGSPPGAPPLRDAAALADPPSAAPALVARASARAYRPDPRDDADATAPPPGLRAAAFEKLGETFEARRAVVAALRDRAAAYGGDDVRWHRLADDGFLVAFARCRKFDEDKAWEEYLAYCLFYKRENWLVRVDTALVRRLFTDRVFTVLTARDAEERVILAISCEPFVAVLEEYARDARVEEVIKAVFFLVRLQVFADVHAQVHGVVLVGDMRGYRLRPLSYLSFSQYKQALHLAQWCVPMRANAFYVQNEPRYVRAVVNALRAFMKPKVRNSFLCCGAELSLLHAVIPPESLPPAFGGTLHNDISTQQQWLDAIDDFAARSNRPGPDADS